MTLLDIAIVLTVAIFGLRGFRKGFIYAAGMFLGTVFSLFIALRYYAPVADWLIQATGWSASWRFIVLILAFLLVERAVKLLFWVATKGFGAITWIPLVGPANKLIGLLFGFFEGLLLCTVFVFALERLVFVPHIVLMLEQSQYLPMLREFSGYIWPLYPDALRILQTSVERAESLLSR